MRKTGPLQLASWPPGRACSCGSPECDTKHWGWSFVEDDPEAFLETIEGIANAQRSEERKKYFLREVLILLERAECGKCTVVTVEPDGSRVGDVDRMDYGESIILELRCHTALDENPETVLRIYFTEPTQELDLVAVSAERKDRTPGGKLQQDDHWRSAEMKVRRWWMDR